MTINPKLVRHGTCDGVGIDVDLSRIEHGYTKTVRLTSAYVTVATPGLPTRPCFTGAPTANLDFPRTIAAGTVLTLLAGEAAALVAAGKAVYA
jgi:hypothetical protein